MLAARYRVLGLIGQGGMGEVYRAYDLILNQAVALKFLGRANMSEAALARFRNEVRIAGQVSHPNVCRVYDIGFIEGFHFLSMEYLDGEDLASLIRRIGRLPQDKAVEFARKICAGLAAAHDRGVLHRDLKPANIMIDGRGQVRITDFGLAALAQEVALGDIRSGTPAYMSPEQKAGKEVTTRSDLYSLGLTLHEMFTGKRRSDTQSAPTEIVKDLDPAVERVILRCLEEDPKRRASSALSVAMALPGGDPIAAALAAGETPSPEMVAASHEREGFSRRAAGAYLAVAVMALLFAALFPDPSNVLNHVPLDLPPDALAFRSRQILGDLGYGDKPRSVAYGFSFANTARLRKVLTGGAGRDNLLTTHRPAIVWFWYRQSTQEFRADSFLANGSLSANGIVTYDSPATDQPGMIRIRTDAKGRLLDLEVRPLSGGAAPTPEPVDARALFSAAGLEQARFSLATPNDVPPVATDRRQAWVGTFEAGRAELVRVEAAWWEGRPVYFSITADSQSLAAANFFNRTLAALGLSFVLIIGATLLAWNNLRLGRGDLRTAMKIACGVFLLALLGGLLVAEHVTSGWEAILITKQLCWASFAAIAAWGAYVGMEPYIRRFWPDALIAWTRLCSGRIRDSLAASHLLAGVTVGAALVVVFRVLFAIGDRRMGGWNLRPPQSFEVLNSATFLTAILSDVIVRRVFAAIIAAFMLVLFRLVVRRTWMAGVFAALVLAAPQFVQTSNSSESVVVNGWALLVPGAIVWLFQRFGLLAALAAGITADILAFPISLESWYAGRSIIVLLIPAAVTAWASWVVLSAQRRPATESAG